MPIYEFRCQNLRCQHEFEVVRKMDNPSAECPKCKCHVERMISKPSPFVWGTGGGWK